VLFKILRDSHDAFASFSVTRYRQEIHRKRKRDVPRQIGSEKDGTAEHGDQYKFSVFVIGGNLFSKRFHAASDLFLGEENLDFIEHISPLTQRLRVLS